MKVFKIICIIIAILILGVLSGGIYVKTVLPGVGAAPDIKAHNSIDKVERGRYLAHHVAVCMDCHSTRRWDLYAAPMSPENIGGGGEIFNQQMGFPGEFYAANITPYTLGEWTDGEIFRAITSGVNKQGKALFPVMAYHRFGQMDKEDIYAIIAYIRTLEPVKKDIPASKPDFPFNFIINTLPQKPNFTTLPTADHPILYGQYIVNAAGCVDCHSQMDKGKIIPGTEFGGGMEFIQPAGILRTSNITFDETTGIGLWSKEDFVARFKMYGDDSYQTPVIGKDELNTPMPWNMYAGMTENDLAAIYEYLKSIPPINHTVEKYTLKK